MSNSRVASVPVAIKTIRQIQGVVDTVVHTISDNSTSLSVIAFLEDATIDAVVNSVDDLSDFAEIVETYVTDSLVSKKRNLNFRITS